MKIIIVGDGKVGFTLAEHLSREEHDVTVIDTNDDALRRASESLDVLCVKGNGASIMALRESGVDTADIIIAAASLDEVNMVCCLTAKRLGAKYTIARVRNVEYAVELSVLKKELGIDMVINPENATAVEISRLLRFPSAANIETFYRGRVELIGFRVQEDDFICGHSLAELNHRVKELPILFCAAERGDEVIIPDGRYAPQAGDKLYLIGQPIGMSQFFKLLGRYTPKVKDVFIVGGGRIAHYLTAILEGMNMHVKLVERNMDRCRHISEVLPRTMVICGDGTDQELLESESVSASDAFIALTDRDEDNLIISLYAMQMGIGKVIAKSNRQNYAGIARAVGLDSVISPKLITANQILQVVRGMENSKGSVMTALYKIASGNAEAMEFVVNQTTRHLGQPLKDLKLKKGILIAVIIHHNRIVIPEGSSSMSQGDTVIIVSRDQGILDVNDIFDESALDLSSAMGGIG
ncbi:Trk system potassium transporter TrkA [Pseudoflavonifractor sp. BIOML-A6]|nr:MULTISPECIES: Trk system potassium transporter TrkA [unclassified Pseudoflavonifractor]MTQ96699.1 Trk system potassium transporter TrkA [Pseudoflavonifractor sp. BIOML-A16]MTR04864.1 Trk system potassium transporter TrkA [Pseudoflavonifractor sp. BIOML-A15]MTR30888.1 Trk system potassium transporter TrkA [Pseudoflavonifractor sp. BIOML-A14]MTR71879.1 Trk system potassium transporter TrkA [Pseudoflavonifractor sp. BIOML-A18]MTS63403.1 Trk system potassium transporter TrkA [Pseudoflavonifract